MAKVVAAIAATTVAVVEAIVRDTTMTVHKAVSYTHLDVYKRQSFSWEGFEFNESLSNEKKFVFTNGKEI